MADAQSGVVKLNPDGTIGVTVAGTRHTLRQITLGELRALRDAYNAAQAEVADYLDFDATPAIRDLEAKVKAAKTKTARQKVRADLSKLNDERDRFVQAQWAGWWRECFATLSNKTLPEPGDDPAEGLEPWMVDSPRAIPTMFSHWRAVPLGGSEGAAATTIVDALTQLAG